MPLIGFGDKENLPKDLNFRHLSMFGGISPLMSYSPILERLDIALPAAKSLSKPGSARNSPNISPEVPAEEDSGILADSISILRYSSRSSTT